MIKLSYQVFLLCIIFIGSNSGCLQDYNSFFNFVTIVCTNISLTDLPNLVVEKDTKYFLQVTNTSVSILPSSVFLKFPSLTKLYLTKLRMKVIIPGAFQGLEKLEELNLAQNELKEITEGVFNALHNLRILDLSNNRIRRLETSALKGANSLIEIFLQNNSISKIEEEFFEQQKLLRTVVLMSNPLEGFCVVGLSNLEVLDLSRCSIEKIDLSSCGGAQKPNLTELNLEHNRLEILENSLLSKSQQLQSLDFGHNRISTIQSEIFRGLEVLYSLNLGYNHIRGIEPDLLKDLTGLIFLDLSNNKIQQLYFGTFDSLKELKYLDISSNSLMDLYQYAFHSLVHLKELHFHNNHISSLHVEDFMKQFQQLKIVSLNHNPWDCVDLVHMSQDFNERSVKIADSGSFGGENVHGITCKNHQSRIVETEEETEIGKISVLLIFSLVVQVIVAVSMLALVWLKLGPFSKSKLSWNSEHTSQMELC